MSRVGSELVEGESDGPQQMLDRSGAEVCGSGSVNESETECWRPCEIKTSNIQGRAQSARPHCGLRLLTSVVAAVADNSCPTRGLA